MIWNFKKTTFIQLLCAIIFTFSFILFSCQLIAQSQINKAQYLKQDSSLKTAQISFVERTYDFGKLRKGEKVSTSFYFKNTGTKPLIILQVQTSCGCTATHWKNQPIQPNETGEITVTFDSSAKEELYGIQNKVILVISNALNKEEKLFITGEVSKSQQ